MTQPVPVPALRRDASFSDFSLGASSWSDNDQFLEKREALAPFRAGIGAQLAGLPTRAGRCDPPTHRPGTAAEAPSVPFPRRLSLPTKLPGLFHKSGCAERLAPSRARPTSSPLRRSAPPSLGKADSNEPDVLGLRSLNLSLPRSGGEGESPTSPSSPRSSPGASPPAYEIFGAEGVTDATAEYQLMIRRRSETMRAFASAPYP